MKTIHSPITEKHPQLTFEGVSILFILYVDDLASAPGHSSKRWPCMIAFKVCSFAVKYVWLFLFWTRRNCSSERSGLEMSKVGEIVKTVLIWTCYSGVPFNSFFFKSLKYVLFIEMESFSLLFVNSLFQFKNTQWTFCVIKYFFTNFTFNDNSVSTYWSTMINLVILYCWRF